MEAAYTDSNNDLNRKSSYPDFPPPAFNNNNNNNNDNDDDDQESNIVETTVTTSNMKKSSSLIWSASTVSVSNRENIKKNGVKAWKFLPILIDPLTYRIRILQDGLAEFICDEKSCLTTLSNIPFLEKNMEVDFAASMLYFEIRIESLGSEYIDPEKVTIGLGISKPEVALDKLPGRHKDSIGILSNDLTVWVQGQPAPLNYEQTFGKVGDIVGCGWQDGMIYFTKNGKNMGPAAFDFNNSLDGKNDLLSQQILHAKIGSIGPSKLSYNFGAKPFAYIPYTEEHVLFH